MTVAKSDHSLPEEQPDRRGAARFKVSEMFAVLESDLFIDSVRVFNIGKLGFSARSFFAYPAGTRVCLQIDGYLMMPARVVWCSHGQFGARFEKPLEEGPLLSLILGEQPQNPVQTNIRPDGRSYPAPLPDPHHGRREVEHHP
jgi:hypothetical protein